MGADLSKIFVDPATLPDNFGGFLQLIFLLCAYAYILYVSSNMISDGSELLLLIKSVAGIVGSVVLPILGAVPDGAIVLFSGLNPNKVLVQEQLSVGVGALAGSTIMLLTIPWVLSVVSGRVDLDANGEALYGKPKGKKNSKGLSLLHSGVSPTGKVKMNSVVMALTCVAYAIIQGPAFASDCGTTHQVDDGKCDTEAHAQVTKWCSFVGLIVCVLAFIAYLVWQVKAAASNPVVNAKTNKMRLQALEMGEVGLRAMFPKDMVDTNSATGLVDNNYKQIEPVVAKFFAKYDVDHDKSLNFAELRALMNDLQVKFTDSEFKAFFEAVDNNRDGTVCLGELCSAVWTLLQRNDNSLGTQGSVNSPGIVLNGVDEEAPGAGAGAGAGEEGGDDDDDDDEEEEEVPEDLRDLDPKSQLRRIKLRALYLMGVGTFVVLIFSDPMVGVLSELGKRINVSGFYVAFVLAPLASNASELLASFNYASKKTRKTITVSFCTLEGAAIMNNTFCLGIFLALIFFRGLIWEFSAETISIVAVQLIMFVIARKRTHRVIDGIIVACLYPLSIALVAFLESSAVGLN